MRTNVSRFSLVFTILFYLSIACLNLWLPLTLSALPPQTPGLPTPTPSPTLAPMPVIPDGPIAGVVPGAFEVTERGSAHYSITISAPPGVGGMEPRLALVYDNRGGNGLLGVGWSLQGLSAISRCGTTTVQDGFIDGVDFDGNDKFCLDGQRLNVISGSYGQNGAEYRTENDTFAKVVSEGVAGDSADSFRVWTKSGLRFEYGKTNDSKVEAQGKASVLTWQVNRISDTLGNYIDFSYTENTSTGELYPLRIQYTGNTNVGLAPVNSIEFQYEARTDAAFGYISGAIHQTTKRLKSIDLLYQGSLQQQYRLSYQSSARTNRSILAEVRQCDANNLCLAPTTFNWKANKQSFAPPTTLIDFPQDPHPGSYYAQHEHVGDVNGDGFSDYVWVPYNKSELWVALGKKTGLHPPQIWLPATIAPGIQPASWNGVHEALVDVNGDGLSDWVWIPNGPQDLWVALSNGNGFDTPTIWLAAYSVSGTHHPYSWEGRYEHFGDVNGDGRADYVWVPDGRYDLWVSLSTGTGFTPPQMWLAQNIVPGGLPFSYYGKHEALVDLNGDNLLDWIWVPWGPQDLWVALSHGTGFDAPQKWLNAGSAAGAHPFSWEGIYEHFGDVNGDGLTDYVWVPEHRNDLWVSLSTGAGLTAPALWLAQNPGNGYNPFSYYGQHQNLTDFNGDGRADWLYVPWGRNDLWLSYSKGDGFLPPEQLLPANGIGGFNPMSSGGIQQQLADLTGDGLSDWVLIPNGSSDLWMASPLDKDTDLLFQITNGHGSQIKVDYQPMTDPNLYTKQTPSAVYPNLEIAGPLFVVSAYEASNGVGGLNKFTYAYRGLRYSLDGRGFLGFESITKSEQSTGKYTVARYYQEYPYQTMLKSSSSYLPNGTLLYRVEHLPDVQLLNGGASHFPFNKESTESVYEADGALIKSINTKREFDTFGNLSKETVAFGSGHQKVLENTFDNDVSNWLIGRLRTTKTTDGSPTTSIETRNATFDYDSVTGLLVKEVTEPGHPTLKLIKEYQHDPFGNIIYSTTSGPSFATRNVQSVYDASGRFEIENYNELAHNTRKTYDPATGEMIELLDPAGRITTWQYDTFGRKLRETRADGTISRMRYYLGAGSGPAQTMYHTYTDASGQPPSIVYYDTTDREIRKEIIGFDGRKIFTDRQYDVLGQLIKLSEPYFQGDPIYWNENEYDLLGRVKKSTAANGGITTTNYAVTGTGIRRVTNLNPLNQKRVEEYDVHDRVIAIEDELGSRVTYAYEQGVLNGVTKLADSTGFILQSNVYDQRGNKVFISEANSGTVAYVYNGLGLLITQTDAKGSTVALEYDLLNRTIKRTEPEGVTNWTYDVTQNGIGRLGAVTAPDFSEQYAYDLFGRLTQTTSVIKGKSFIIGQSYDQYGRAAKVTYPTSFAIQNGYNALGFLEKIVRVGDGAILWRAKETTARGQVKQFELGNGLETALTFAPQTGLPTSMVTGTPVSGGGSLQGTVQNLVVDFDQIGNLRWRSDLIQNLTESFTYDGLNRVKDATILNGTSVHVDYLPNGNISFKSDVGSYTYGENNTGPHALTSISGAKSNTFTYDVNGNQLASLYRQVTYSSSNRPVTITKGGVTLNFGYGPERTLVYRERTSGTAFEAKRYLGKLYERIDKSSGAVTHRHNIFAGQRSIAVFVKHSNAPSETLYLHKDHLGSPMAVTDQAGSIVELLSFDAWGQRRQTNWTPATGPIFSDLTQAFTGHEQLDDVNLVHMGGRVYDPETGRFLSADPFVQEPENIQALNRYSYVLNNPLSTIDPSGFFFGKLFKSISNTAKAFFKDPKAIILTVALTIATGPGGFLAGLEPLQVAGLAFATGSGLTLASGGSLGDSLKAGITSVVSAHIGGMAALENPVANFVVQGSIRGVASIASGGKFEHGFVSYAMQSALTTAIHYGMNSAASSSSAAGKNSQLARQVSDVAGETYAETGGGKFSNGAVTDSFAKSTGLANTANTAADWESNDSLYSMPTKSSFDLPGALSKYEKVFDALGSSEDILGKKTWVRNIGGKILNRVGFLGNAIIHAGEIKANPNALRPKVDLFMDVVGVLPVVNPLSLGYTLGGLAAEGLDKLGAFDAYVAYTSQ